MSQQPQWISPRLPQDLFLLLEWRSFSSLDHIPGTILKHTLLMSEARRANNTFSIACPVLTSHAVAIFHF